MNEQIHIGFHCAYCETPFLLTDRLRKMRLAQGVEMAFCSKSCATHFHNVAKNINAPLG